jgi:1-acyl-sn-glycerol-3-phosphate acyltransferase
MSVAVLNFFLLRTSHILGTVYTITGRENLPENKPLILVCNHQSMHDIIPIIWFLRNEGFEIKTDRVGLHNELGQKVEVTNYILINKK